MDLSVTLPSASSRPAAERSVRRDQLHLLGMLLPWAALAVMWWRVFDATRAGMLAIAAGFVVLCAAVTVGLTAWWVAHNLTIHRRKGPRTGAPDVELDYSRDWTGRPVRANWSAVHAATTIVIVHIDGEKRFIAGGRGDHPRRYRVRRGPEERTALRSPEDLQAAR